MPTHLDSTALHSRLTKIDFESIEKERDFIAETIWKFYNVGMSYKEFASEIVAMAEERQKMMHEATLKNKPFDKDVDRKNLERLKQIVYLSHSWPTISEVGEEASYAAWLIAQHANHDKHFQEECLELMNQVKSDVLPSNIAYLVDRVAVNKGEPQTYGTQFRKNEDGNLVPYPIKNLDNLEKSRRKMGLESFLVYEQKMKGEFKWPEGYENPKVGRFYKAL